MPISQSPYVSASSAWESFVAWHGGGAWFGSAPSSDFSCAARLARRTIATRERTSWSRLGPPGGARRIRGVRARRAPRARVASCARCAAAMRDAVRGVRSRNETAWSRTMRERARARSGCCRCTSPACNAAASTAASPRAGTPRSSRWCGPAGFVVRPRAAARRRRGFAAGQLAFLRTSPRAAADGDRQHAELRSHRGLAAYLRATAAEVAAPRAARSRELQRARAPRDASALARTRADVARACVKAAAAAPCCSAGRWFAAVGNGAAGAVRRRA